jgi:hypothetical protein
LSSRTISSIGWVTARRRLRCSPKSIDALIRHVMCAALGASTVAIRRLRGSFGVNPWDCSPRSMSAHSSTHSGRSKTKSPRRPVVPPVAITR